MILLFRHTQTELNKSGRFQGILDSSLTSTGISQAKHLNSLLLNNFGTDYSDFMFFSSPSKRCLATAEIIFAGAKTRERQIVEALREQDFGVWEGLRSNEIESRWPFVWNHYMEDERSYRPLNGESYLELKERVKNFLIDIDMSKNIIIFTHKFPSIAIRELTLGGTFKYHPQDVFYQINLKKHTIKTFS